ncbi:MAG: GGDEF domain-containing response regulator [Desulfobacteraceae bacterium]|nr:GGDEF domain-containing response regulator [Desulfobacteraceae bacterium]
MNEKDITILFVDHHEEIKDQLEDYLVNEPYQKLITNCAKDGLQILLQQPIQVVVSDLIIKDLDGMVLLQLIKKQYPQIVRLAFCSNEDQVEMAKRINNGDIFRYIPKPLKENDVKKTLLEAVDHYLLNRDKSQLIMALSRKNESLKHLAMHDDLTGLYNIRYLYKDLEKRVGTKGTEFSVIFMDMDNFKETVDTYGHLNGSQALKEVAGTIRQVIEPPAYGVAYGGDEFVIVLPGLDKEQARGKSQKIRETMSKTRYLEGQGNKVELKASYGISTFPEDGKNLPDLLARADNLLFDVKSKGKNGIGT